MKKWLLALILVLLTGCSVNYNVMINDDFSVNEKAIIQLDDDFYEQYYRTTRKNVLTELLDGYSSILNENNYTYNISDDKNPFITLEKKHASVEDFINNSILFNDYFDKINYNKNDNKLIINTEGFNPNDRDNPDRFNISELSIIIKPSFKITKHNAKEFNEEENSLTYVLNNEDDNFNILLELDINKRFNPLGKGTKYMIIFVGLAIIAWIFVIVKSRKNKI